LEQSWRKVDLVTGRDDHRRVLLVSELSLLRFLVGDSVVDGLVLLVRLLIEEKFPDAIINLVSLLQVDVCELVFLLQNLLVALNVDMIVQKWLLLDEWFAVLRLLLLVKALSQSESLLFLKSLLLYLQLLEMNLFRDQSILDAN
jgi:hypothetical protein